MWQSTLSIPTYPPPGLAQGGGSDTVGRHVISVMKSWNTTANTDWLCHPFPAVDNVTGIGVKRAQGHTLIVITKYMHHLDCQRDLKYSKPFRCYHGLMITFLSRGILWIPYFMWMNDVKLEYADTGLCGWVMLSLNMLIQLVWHIAEDSWKPKVFPS